MSGWYALLSYQKCMKSLFFENQMFHIFFILPFTSVFYFSRSFTLICLYFWSFLSNSFLGSESESRSVVSNSLQPHGDYPVHGILQARILAWVAFPFTRGSSQPRDRTQVSLHQGIFPTQGSNPGFPSSGDLSNPGIEPRFPTSQADSLPAEPQGKPKNTVVVVYSFSSGSSRPKSQTEVSCIAGEFFNNWATREPSSK